MKYLSIAMIGLMLTLWIFFAVREFRAAIRKPGWLRVVRLFAATCIGVGGLGFFGTALVASSGVHLSFEWPVGYATDVVSTKDNYFVVPHTPSGRVQVYDSKWKFVRGWSVEAGAGTFNLYITDTNHIHVVTARRQMHYVYDLGGEMLSSENYSSKGMNYSSFPKEGDSYLVPTPAWLWVFTSPFYSWLTGMIGIGLFVVIDKVKRKKRTHNL